MAKHFGSVCLSLNTVQSMLSPFCRRRSVVSLGGYAYWFLIVTHKYKVMDKTAITTRHAVSRPARNFKAFFIFTLNIFHSRITRLTIGSKPSACGGGSAKR
jgi:hypothetical protein